MWFLWTYYIINNELILFLAITLYFSFCVTWRQGLFCLRVICTCICSFLIYCISVIISNFIHLQPSTFTSFSIQHWWLVYQVFVDVLARCQWSTCYFFACMILLILTKILRLISDSSRFQEAADRVSCVAHLLVVGMYPLCISRIV